VNDFMMTLCDTSYIKFWKCRKKEEKKEKETRKLKMYVMSSSWHENVETRNHQILYILYTWVK